MSGDTVSDFSAHRYIIKVLLHVTGLWPQEYPSILYRLIPIPFFFVNSCVIFGTIFHVKAHLTNIALLTKGLNTMSSFLTINLKMTCVLVYHKKYCELHEILDRHFNELLSDEELSRIILVNFRIFRRISWAFTFFVFVVVSLIAVPPVISLVNQYFSTVDPMIYPLVYPTAYPWSLNRPGLRYKIHFIIELLATVAQFSVSPCIDSLFMFYGFQMTGRFRLMAHRLSTIHKIIDERKVIRECVMQQQLILRSRDLLSTIFGPMVLWLMTANAISLCTIIFQLSQMKTMTLSTTVHFVAYVMVKIIQTFMYAYTGTFLTAESENYQQAIYDCDWHANKYLMTSAIIMLSQKPILITACSFSVISLDIFVKVLNTAISYFFLLQTVS